MVPMRRRISRRQARQRGGQRLFRWLALAAAGLLATYIFLVETEVKPRLDALGEYHCRAIVAEAMNAAVAEALAHEPALVDALYQVEHGPDGRVSAVQSDAAALNAARVALVGAVQAALEALKEESWQIPLGSLSGWTVLSGLGPARTLTLCPEGYVTGTREEDAEAVGVNNTRYTLTLVLQATINLVLDGRGGTAQISERVPIASLLLAGEPPTYYGGA